MVTIYRFSCNRDGQSDQLHVRFSGVSYIFRGSRFPGGDKYGLDGKTYLLYIRLSASQQQNLCALNNHFLETKEGVHQCKISCSSLTRSDLCNMDGKTISFHGGEQSYSTFA